ncbi:UNVERIFIED_CONTAM: hypothetical protein NCL1_31917 [Trichonephila clavipes]
MVYETIYLYLSFHILFEVWWEWNRLGGREHLTEFWMLSIQSSEEQTEDSFNIKYSFWVIKCYLLDVFH